eukprot:scaffold15083_cov97-Amphora_coffeaeformis.AAC.1
MKLEDRISLHQIIEFRAPGHVGRPIARVLVRVDTVFKGRDDGRVRSIGQGLSVRNSREFATAVHGASAAQKPKVGAPNARCLQFSLVATQLTTNVLVGPAFKDRVCGTHHVREASVVAGQATVVGRRHDHKTNVTRGALKISIVVGFFAVGAVGGSGKGHKEGSQSQAEHGKCLFCFALLCVPSLVGAKKGLIAKVVKT